MAGQNGEPEDDDAPDLDDLGDLGDEDDEQDDDDGDQEDKSWKPPTKGEWDRAQRRLKKYAAAQRGKGAPIDDQFADQVRSKPRGKVEEEEDDEGDRGRAAVAAADHRAKRQAGVAALMGAGLTKEQAKSAVGLLDLRNVELDEDGDADLEDEVEELKERFPGLFETTVRYRRPPSARRTPEADQRRVPRDPSSRTDRALLRAAGFDTTKMSERDTNGLDAAERRRLKEAGY